MIKRALLRHANVALPPVARFVRWVPSARRFCESVEAQCRPHALRWWACLVLCTVALIYCSFIALTTSGTTILRPLHLTAVEAGSDDLEVTTSLRRRLPAAVPDPTQIHDHNQQLPFLETVGATHPMFHLRHVLLTTFWGEPPLAAAHFGNRGLEDDEDAGKKRVGTTSTSTAPPSSFYHGRKVPSLQWIVAFLASFLDVTATMRRSSSLGGNSSLDSSDGVVFFLDPKTLIAMVETIQSLQRGPEYLEQLFGGVQCFFVVVVTGAGGFSDRRSVLDRLAGVVRDGRVVDVQLERSVVVLPAVPYMATPWASSVGNGANNFRFAFYRDFLTAALHARTGGEGGHHNGQGEDEGGGERLVWITDNTDVVFQRFPFDLDKDRNCYPPLVSRGVDTSGSGPRRRFLRLPWVVFTLEDASKTFRNERYNRRWMQCYGSNAVRRLALERQRIACAGVTYGNHRGVLHYVMAQVAELTAPPLVACARDTIHATLDQATHNMLLHRWLSGLPKWMAGDDGRRPREAWLSAAVGGVDRTSSREQEQGAEEEKRWLWLSESYRKSRLETTTSKTPFFAIVTVTEPLCVLHGNFARPVFQSVLQRNNITTARRGGGSGSDETAVVVVPPSGGGHGGTSSVFAVVHQYTSDRIPKMMRVVEAKYLLRRGASKG